jgi:hypothetical protein
MKMAHVYVHRDREPREGCSSEEGSDVDMDEAGEKKLE